MPEMMYDGVAINYRIDGPAGAPVPLLSNYLGTSLEVWESQADALRDDFQVLRYDTRPRQIFGAARHLQNCAGRYGRSAPA